MFHANKCEKKRISQVLFFSDRKKYLSNIQIITLLAILISLRLIMQYFSIYIPQFGMSISISWLPIIVTGWIFGPIIGLVVGGIADTIAYLIKPGQVWFWLYAIQEPIVGFLSGIVSFIYQMRINKLNNTFRLGTKNRFTIDIIIFNIFLISFLVLTLITVFHWADGNFKFQGSNGLLEGGFFNSYKYVLFGAFIFFVASIQVFFIYFLRKKKDKSILLLIYVSIIVIMNAFVFSFILGPVSSIEYFKFLNDGREPSSLIKYGVIYYLIPRILKEAIKSPIQIYILLSLIPIVNFAYERIANNKKLKW
ncbi:MAG: ECF transporter S component [Malacoplasma sp.]